MIDMMGTIGMTDRTDDGRCLLPSPKKSFRLAVLPLFFSGRIPSPLFCLASFPFLTSLFFDHKG